MHWIKPIWIKPAMRQGRTFSIRLEYPNERIGFFSSRSSSVFLGLFIGLFILLSPVSARAQSQSVDIRPLAERLTSDALLRAFKGVTHEGAYNFNLDGLAGAHYRETHMSDSRINYQEAGETLIGVWTLRKDKICYHYLSDLMDGGCFRVYRIKNCYYFYSDTFLEREDELDQNYWTARSVKAGEEPLCVAGLS